MKIEGYRELIVWKKGIELVVEVYKLTERFPRSEIYGLTSQMRRASVSIPSNIAEGRRRGSRKDFRHFLLIAFGSGAELETQIEIARLLKFNLNLDTTKVESILGEVMRMLNKMIATLNLPATS